MRRFALLTALAGVAVAQAATVTLTPVVSGSRIDSGSPSTLGYGVGWFPGGDPINVSRNFFVFDLSSVSGPITGATLRLENPVAGYLSADASETYTVFDVTSSIADVTSGFANVAVYTDLGTGIAYGSTSATAASNGTVLDIALNPEALAFLNGSSGQIALGGALTTLALGSTNELLFAGSTNSLVRELVLITDPIPEPATIVLMTAGLGALMLVRRARP
jgi:hypothetical protein